MRRRSKNAAIVGGAVALSLMMAAPVLCRNRKERQKHIRERPGDMGAGNISVMDTEFWEDKAAANVQTYGNIRTSASDKGQVAGVILPGCQADVLGTVGSWTRIRSGKITGYIETESLVFGEEARVHYKNVYGFDAP